MWLNSFSTGSNSFEDRCVVFLVFLIRRDLLKGCKIKVVFVLLFFFVVFWFECFFSGWVGVTSKLSDDALERNVNIRYDN